MCIRVRRWEALQMGTPCGPLHLGGRVAGIHMFFADNDSTAADSEAMIDQNRLKLNLLKI
jgi:hypothetical protein